MKPTAVKNPFVPPRILSHPRAMSIWPVLTTTIVFLVMIGLYTAAFHGDLSALVCVDETQLGQAPFTYVTTGFAKNGYDGQYYYALAQNPWVRGTRGIDVPARHLRLLYPALAWSLTGGDPQGLLWALPLLNLLALAGLTWLGASVARRHGLSAWWGVLLPIVAGAYMPAFRNLSDPLSLLAVTGLLVAFGRRAAWPVLLLCGLAAVFSREQNVLVVAVVLLAALWERRASVVLALGSCLLAWLSFVVLLWISYDAWPFLPAGNLGLPFVGVIGHLQYLQSPTVSITTKLIHGFGLAMLGLQIVLACGLVLRRPSSRPVLVIMLIGVALALCGGLAIYASPWSFLRVFTWIPLGIWLISVHAKRPWPILLMAPMALWPMLVIAQQWL